MRKILIASLLFATALVGLGGRAHADDVEAPISGSASAAGTTESDPEAVPGEVEAPKDEQGREEEVNVDKSKGINWTSFSYGGKDYFGGKFGDGKMHVTDVHGQKLKTDDDEEKMSPPFILMLVNFGLLLLILRKWGSPVAKKFAEERHDLIKNALDEAAALRDAAHKKLALYEEKLQAADAEIATMVAGLKADAEADKARMIAAAEASAVQLRKDAEQRIAAEIETARAQLTRDVTAAAVIAAEKIVRANATGDDQQKLVGNFISNVQNPQPGARS